MANYLAITNENNNVIIGDDFPILQPVENSLFIFESFGGAAFDTTEGIHNFGPFRATRNNHTPDAIYKFSDYTAAETFTVFRMYHPGSNERTTSQSVFEKLTINDYPSIRLSAFENRKVHVQGVRLTYKRAQTHTDEAALVAYNEQGDLVFDSSLGVAHLLANFEYNSNLEGGDLDFSLGNFAGYNLDFNRIFFRVGRLLYKNKTEFRAGGSQYRAGWYCWVPRLYMTNSDDLRVHLRYFTSNNYGVNDSAPLSDTFLLQVFYLPSIRLL